jgi:hypothetical protein
MTQKKPTNKQTPFAHLHALLIDGLLQLLADLLQLVFQVVALLEQPRQLRISLPRFVTLHKQTTLCN